MSTHAVTSCDTYEIAFYFVKGYSTENIHVINKDGSLVCQFSIVGDQSLRSIQQEYFNNPTVKLTDYRNMLNRARSLMGIALKTAKDEARASKKEVSK